MFNWEDQELANIIWGEADDNIVPYPAESEKKSQSVSVDQDNNEANKEAANNSLTGKKTDPEKGPEISEDLNGDREFRDIIGNCWVNIESFDDLDHIFRNDELVGHASLDSTDELWTASRDVDSVVKPSSLTLYSTSWGLEAPGHSSGQFDFNTEYLHNENQSYAVGYEKAADSTCYTQERLHSRFDQANIDITANPKLILEKTALGMTGKTLSKPEAAARKLPSTDKSLKKDNWHRSWSKSKLKSDKTSNLRRSRDIYSTWPTSALNFQQFDSQSVPETPKNYAPPILGLHNTPQQSTCLPYQQITNPYFAAYSYGNLSDQSVLSSAKASLSDKVSMDKSTVPPIKHLNMTPQEKIEKLRRRQQMRAMLAIQKQQQQLSHPVPISDYSVAQKSSQEDQVLHLESADSEAEENIIPTYDPNSLLKQDDSSAISVEEEDQNVEDTVLYQLQDIVSQSDMKIRLCIRDSLFRLAQSAMQRHYASESSSENRSAVCKPNILKEGISNQESFIKMPSAETETNYIDRAVAHLLFHRPFKSSVKHPWNPESAMSPKIPSDLEMDASSSLSLNFVTKTSENEENISTHAVEELSEQPQTDVSVNRKIKQKMVESID